MSSAKKIPGISIVLGIFPVFDVKFDVIIFSTMILGVKYWLRMGAKPIILRAEAVIWGIYETRV
jgi:hypothetical protein